MKNIPNKHMDKPFMPLANMDFAKVLNEAKADTQTGQALLNKYRQALLANEATCGLVNNFINESRDVRYDRGIVEVLECIGDTINNVPTLWQLATACENIMANSSQYNYLNRNAVKQVLPLLEMEEKDVITYIKGGALKSVMYCESFRNIAKNIFKDNNRFVTEDYTATQPVSMVEVNESNVYFEVLGHIYNIHEDRIDEANASQVSADFLEVSRLLESRNAQFEDEKLNVMAGNVKYTISEEAGVVTCKRVGKDQEQTFNTVEELREHNRLVVGATTYNQRNQMAALLESVAKAFEHFDDIMRLSNVKIVESKNDKFFVIEHKDNMFAMALRSNHTNAWKVNANVVEALNLIKEKTHLNLKQDYKDNIEEAFKNREREEKQQIQESIEQDAIAARKRKIEALMEQYKGDEAKLAVLAKVAAELGTLQ